MLFRLIDNPVILIYTIIVFLVSVTIHEVAHGLVSYKLGDPTAKMMGRLSLNPMRHLDVFGAIMILVAGFGWAKPVPVNPMYYKDRKKGTMLVSVAGPLSNILLAFIFSIPMVYLGSRFGIDNNTLFRSRLLYYLPSIRWDAILFNLSRFFFVLNINLAVFNLLPVPPLDGSKILGGLLPSRYYFRMLEYERFFPVILLLLMFMRPNILYTIMSPFIWAVETAIRFLLLPLTKALAPRQDLFEVLKELINNIPV